jgi:uncharacterized protein YjiS (DUF1127 family)
MTIRTLTSPTRDIGPCDHTRPGSLWQDFISRLVAARHRLSSRQALLEMDARMLRDIGITHAEAVEEARRAPWDLAPITRRR